MKIFGDFKEILAKKLIYVFKKYIYGYLRQFRQFQNLLLWSLERF